MRDIILRNHGILALFANLLLILLLTSCGNEKYHYHYSTPVSEAIDFRLLNNHKFALSVDFDQFPDYHIGSYLIVKDTLYLKQGDEDELIILNEIEYQYDTLVSPDSILLQTKFVPEYLYNHSIQYYYDSIQYILNNQLVGIGFGTPKNPHSLIIERPDNIKNSIELISDTTLVPDVEFRLEPKYNVVQFRFFVYRNFLFNEYEMMDVLPKSLRIKMKKYYIVWIE